MNGNKSQTWAKTLHDKLYLHTSYSGDEATVVGHSLPHILEVGRPPVAAHHRGAPRVGTCTQSLVTNEA